MTNDEIRRRATDVVRMLMVHHQDVPAEYIRSLTGLADSITTTLDLLHRINVSEAAEKNSGASP